MRKSRDAVLAKIDTPEINSLIGDIQCLAAEIQALSFISFLEKRKLKKELSVLKEKLRQAVKDVQ
jgi:hypothetical protein